MIYSNVGNSSRRISFSTLKAYQEFCSDVSVLDVLCLSLWPFHPDADCDTLSVELCVVWIDDPKSLAKVFLFLGISCPLNSFQSKSYC